MAELRSNKAVPVFDSRLVEFPLDRVTISQLRKLHYRMVTADMLSGMRAGDINGLAGHEWDLRLAERAFAKAAGLPDPHPEVERTSEVSDLNYIYKLYGVSHGAHETRQLVRDFERAAASQAKRQR